jgi:hypothetical protein
VDPESTRAHHRTGWSSSARDRRLRDPAHFPVLLRVPVTTTVVSVVTIAVVTIAVIAVVTIAVIAVVTIAVPAMVDIAVAAVMIAVVTVVPIVVVEVAMATVVVIALAVLPARGMPGLSAAVAIPVAGPPAIALPFGFPPTLGPDVSTIAPLVRARDPDEARTRRRWRRHDLRRRRRRGRVVDIHRGRCDVGRALAPCSRDPAVMVALPFPMASVPLAARTLALPVSAARDIPAPAPLVASFDPHPTPAWSYVLDWRRGRLMVLPAGGLCELGLGSDRM